MNKTMMKAIVLAFGALAWAPVAAVAAPSAEASAAGDTPEIYFYAFSLNEENASAPESVKLVQDWILEQIGVLVHPVLPPRGEAEEKLTLLLASGEQLDIFRSSWAKYRALDAIQPINDVLPEYGPTVMNAFPAEFWDLMSDSEGNIWGVVADFPRADQPLYVRRDWAEQLDMAVPADVTSLEEFLAAVMDADPAGNGTTIPLMANLTGLLSGVAGGFIPGGYANWQDARGSINPPEIHPGYRDFLAAMNGWFANGYLYKEFSIVNRAAIDQAVRDNRVAASLAGAGRIADRNHYHLRAAVPNAEYVMSPLSGPEGLAETMRKGSDRALMIDKRSRHPDAAMQFIDLGFQWDQAYGYLTTRHGIQGLHWEFADTVNDTGLSVLDDTYKGDLAVGVSIVNAVRSGAATPDRAEFYEFLGTHFWDFSRVKRPFDWDVVYDPGQLLENVSAYNDIDRMIQEETVKFITGARSLDTYDGFVADLRRLGVDTLVAELTRQYRLAKGG